MPRADCGLDVRYPAFGIEMQQQHDTPLPAAFNRFVWIERFFCQGGQCGSQCLTA